MKKIGFALIMVLFIFVSVPVSALELTGNAWLISQEETSIPESLELMYQGELTLIGLGPIRLIGGLDYAGETKDIGHLFNLYRGKIEEADFNDYEGYLNMISGATGRVRVDWPLFNGLAVIGSVGHRFAGKLEVTNGTDGQSVNTGVYGGTIFSGGLSLELLRGLRLSSIYEIGPSLQELHGSKKEAFWKSWDVGLEYRIPFISAKAGYRQQRLENDVNGFDLNGFYLGAGIHF